MLYAVIASISTLFKETYTYLDLNETSLSLCFYAVSEEMLIATFINGSLLD